MQKYALALVPLAFAASAWVTCSSGSGGSGEQVGGGAASDGFDRNAMLAQLANQVVLPTYRQFAADTQALSAACSAWAASAEPASAGAERDAARATWRTAMRTWQRAEVMSFGPAGSSSDFTGGADLRDAIYSWPTVNACRVDQETVEQVYGEPSFFEVELVNVYGLDALEYLLFRQDSDNACPAQVAINADGAWAALGEAEIASRRASYAAAVAAHVAERARALRDAWEPSSGNFAGMLAGAGKTGSAYPSAQAALDEVFAAMWYVERQVKDAKLAEPAGLSPGCSSESCPESLESVWAHHSKENVRANLEGLRALFVGAAPSIEGARAAEVGSESADGLGFDDWLAARGASDLAERMAASLDAALAAVDAVDGTLAQALASDLEGVRDVHVAVKAITDDLKTQFVTVLGLRVPQEGAGDND